MIRLAVLVAAICAFATACSYKEEKVVAPADPALAPAAPPPATTSSTTLSAGVALPPG
jgi:hypothetical protein